MTNEPIASPWLPRELEWLWNTGATTPATARSKSHIAPPFFFTRGANKQMKSAERI
jgi:hypothetical protein